MNKKEQAELIKIFKRIRQLNAMLDRLPKISRKRKARPAKKKGKRK